MAVETTDWNVTDHLDSDAAILAYLEAASRTATQR